MGALIMKPQNKTTNLARSILTGIGVAIGCLLLGTLLDYALTQILSQFFIPDCSEDCYFNVFNALFAVVAFLSAAGGLLAGLRVHKR